MLQTSPEYGETFTLIRNKGMRKVCLKAITAVATLKHVYVLDIHKLTCLFHFPVFQEVLKLLTPSHIFAINMGEDAGIFDRSHFELLATKILDGSSAVRRWFAESNPNYTSCNMG